MIILKFLAVVCIGVIVLSFLLAVLPDEFFTESVEEKNENVYINKSCSCLIENRRKLLTEYNLLLLKDKKKKRRKQILKDIKEIDKSIIILSKTLTEVNECKEAIKILTEIIENNPFVKGEYYEKIS